MFEVSLTVAAFMGSMIAMTAVTWSASGVLGNTFNIEKLYVAMLLGPLTGLLAHGAGLLPTPATGWPSWAFSAFMGLICTVGAKTFADYGPASITNLLKRNKA